MAVVELKVCYLDGACGDRRPKRSVPAREMLWALLFSLPDSEPYPESPTPTVLRMKLVGASPAPQVAGLTGQPGQEQLLHRQ